MLRHHFQQFFTSTSYVFPLRAVRFRQHPSLFASACNALGPILFFLLRQMRLLDKNGKSSGRPDGQYLHRVYLRLPGNDGPVNACLLYMTFLHLHRLICFSVEFSVSVTRRCRSKCSAIFSCRTVTLPDTGWAILRFLCGIVISFDACFNLKGTGIFPKCPHNTLRAPCGVLTIIAQILQIFSHTQSV